MRSGEGRGLSTDGPEAGGQRSLKGADVSSSDGDAHAATEIDPAVSARIGEVYKRAERSARASDTAGKELSPPGAEDERIRR